MNRKILISTILTLLLSLVVVFVVMAGTTRDRGTLETDPLAGKVNWTAWLSVSDGSGGIVHPPQEIMTEDSFNAAQGPGGGYTDAGWQIQVENMQRETANIPVNMMFCGLDTRVGNNWWHNFEWKIDESTTDHGEVPLKAETSFTAPPMKVEFDDNEAVFKISFSGETNTEYYVYRSQNPASDAVNDRSNGRYVRVGPVTTDAQGLGEYVDDDFNPDFPAWYVVMYFAEDFNGHHGCHSEPGPLLKQCVLNFVALYNPEDHAVELSWESVSDAGIESFNVYRSENSTGMDEKLNTVPIAAEPAGGPFTFTDDDLGDAETYFYWIEIVGGVVCQEFAGPVAVEIVTEEGPYGYYLPLFFK